MLFVNLFSNVAFFVINTLVSIWFVPYLIHHMGLVVYGLVPLVITITSYFNLITAGLNMALSRYMTIALAQANKEEANIIFNTAFWTGLILSVFTLIIGLAISFFMSGWINIPSGYQHQVMILFVCTLVAFVITTFGSTFNIVSYCNNRLDLQNMGNILGVIARVAIVVVLFNVFTPNLWQVGLGTAAAALVSCLLSLFICYNLFPELTIGIKFFSKSTLKKLSKTGIWVFISQIGTILLVNIDLLVANKLFGAEAGGRYASVLQWSLLLRNFALVVSGIFGPTILAYYAQDRMEDLIDYIKKSIKFVGLLISLPVGLICGLGKPLLHVWLGNEFTSLSLLMVILTAHLALNLAYLPLHHITMATNKVKWPAISQIVAGVINLILAIVLAKLLGVYGIALAGAIVLLLRNILFTPLYVAHVIKKPFNTFIKEIVPIVILTIVVALSSYFLSLILNIDSWLKLLSTSALVFLVFSIFCWTFILDLTEKSFIFNMLNKFKKLSFAYAEKNTK